MHYIPDPKALVYSELQFISTAFPRATVEVSYDAIFDEVSGEIYNLYIAEQQDNGQLIVFVDTAIVTGFAN
jgi:hypothetical protein